MLWNKEQEQERILKATLCYVYMMPLLRRYIKYVLGLDVVEQRARAGEDSESNSLLRIHYALIEKVY